jgi:exonuclease VII small subunit
LALWQRGEEVAAVCTEWLDRARETLEATQADDDEDAK